MTTDTPTFFERQWRCVADEGLVIRFRPEPPDGSPLQFTICFPDEAARASSEQTFRDLQLDWPEVGSVWSPKDIYGAAPAETHG